VLFADSKVLVVGLILHGIVRQQPCTDDGGVAASVKECDGPTVEQLHGHVHILKLLDI